MEFVKVVRVPSIEHAAEVIGLKGAKIKMLKNLTKAKILTPNPGGDPIFVIKAPSEEALSTCESVILNSVANFDNIRLQKRNIIMPRESVVTTIRLFNNQIKIIIGKDGSVIKKIEELFNVFIKSPDRSTAIASKEPIFVISGRQQDVNNCITFIKLVLYQSNNDVHLTIDEFLNIEPLLTNYMNSIINLESINKKLLMDALSIKNVKLKLMETKVSTTTRVKFYCPLCFCYTTKKAKAFPCKHFVCCQNCIVPLYRHPDAKCTTCSKKIDQFEILFN